MAIKSSVDSITFYSESYPSASVTCRLEGAPEEDKWAFHMMTLTGGAQVSNVPEVVVVNGAAQRDAFGEAVVEVLTARVEAVTEADEAFRNALGALAVEVNPV